MILEVILLVLTVLTGIAMLIGRLKGTPEGQSTLIDYGRSLFPVIFIVFALRSFIAEPFRIPSGSMLPTLHLGDFILVNKSAYGVKLPIIHKTVFPTGSPKRGDVVVFKYPKNKRSNYIKRLIGMPGDTVKMDGQDLFINGELIKADVVKTDHVARDRGRGYITTIMNETLGEVKHDILVQKVSRIKGFETVVPEGQYFVMGDNRDNSSDSRVWGFVPEDLMVGKALFIWFSWDTVGGGGADWGRIAQSID